MSSKKGLYNGIIRLTSSDFFGMTSDFNADITKEKEFLWSINEPKDDFERSYAQYRCQAFLRNKWSLFILNVGCALAMIPYLIKCRFAHVNFKEKKDAVFAIVLKNQPKIPSSLLMKYNNRYVTIDHEEACLNGYDLLFMWRLFKKRPFSAYFLFHLLIKISIYRGFIVKYNPKMLVVNEEFSCVSSTMTLYCEQQGIEHVNIMHGEKDYYIRDSFFRFHKCYVWDRWYIALFQSLRADKSEFVVEIPPCFKLDKPDEGITVDYKYYLWGNEKLEKIAQCLHMLKNKGFTIKVRPHPTFTNAEKLRNYFSEDEVEDCSLSTEVSLVQTRNAISLYSTVLLQAYFSGINIVIDNLNFPDEYAKLKELKYILIGKKHDMLSEILKK